MKCGSMNPTTIRLSASTYARLRRIGRPSLDVPTAASADGSCAAWLTMR